MKILLFIALASVLKAQTPVPTQKPAPTPPTYQPRRTPQDKQVHKGMPKQLGPAQQK